MFFATRHIQGTMIIKIGSDLNIGLRVIATDGC